MANGNKRVWRCPTCALPSCDVFLPVSASRKLLVRGRAQYTAPVRAALIALKGLCARTLWHRRRHPSAITVLCVVLECVCDQTPQRAIITGAPQSCLHTQYKRNFVQVLGDATDSGLLRFCDKVIAVDELRDAFETVFSIPFNSKNKWALTMVRVPGDNDSLVVMIKGAPEYIIKRCAACGHVCFCVWPRLFLPVAMLPSSFYRVSSCHGLAHKDHSLSRISPWSS